MSDSDAQTEQHGCIVCGKVYFIEATYSAAGTLEKCMVITPGGRCLPGTDRPFVACDVHTSDQIESAQERHASRNVDEEEEE